MKTKISLFVFSLICALPALAGTPTMPPPDSTTPLPEPSMLALFAAAAIAITVLTKFRK